MLQITELASFGTYEGQIYCYVRSHSSLVLPLIAVCLLNYSVESYCCFHYIVFCPLSIYFLVTHMDFAVVTKLILLFFTTCDINHVIPNNIKYLKSPLHKIKFFHTEGRSSFEGCRVHDIWKKLRRKKSACEMNLSMYELS